jgi:hypothetical protein
MPTENNISEQTFDIPAPTGPNWWMTIRSVFKPIISWSLSLLPGFDHTLLKQEALFSCDNIITGERV